MIKQPIASSVSSSIFLRTIVINNNIDDQGGPGPLNSIFTNQFISVARVKLRVVVLKVAISGPHPTLL